MVEPRIWGSSAWKFMHCVTLAYPINPTETDKNDIRQFFDIMPKVLPCNVCKNNCKGHFAANPLTDQILYSRENLVRWLIDIHNSVNEMHGKPKLSYADAVNKIMDVKSGVKYDFVTIGLVMCVIFLMTVCIILIMNME